MAATEEWPRVQAAHVHSFVAQVMEAAGTATEHAQNLAEVLTLADTRGHYSHGINRLEWYLRDIKMENANKEGSPAVLKETVATAWVDGQNLLGPSVGKFCMELAMKKAKEVGIGMVVAKESNHFGIAGWYPLMAKDAGLIGFSFTNTSPCVVPTRAKKCHLGTNPLSMAAPAGEDSFVLDMATSSVALGKVEVAQRNEAPIPNTWGCDEEGMPSTKPSTILDQGGLFPLGGSEESGGYKGYGLAFMVEILCGVLGGASFGPNVRGWFTSQGQSAQLGQCFMAIDPSFFAPDFEGRLGNFIDTTRNLEPIAGKGEVLIAGDPERARMADAEANGGIPYHPHVLTAMDKIADEMKIQRLPRNK